MEMMRIDGWVMFTLLQFYSNLDPSRSTKMSNKYSVLNKYCLTSQQCCWLAPKAATITIAIIGLLQSLSYIIFFFTGEEYLIQSGMHPNAVQVIIHMYAITGLLLFSLYILLLVAALIYSESLILLYQWCIIFYSMIDVIFFTYMSATSNDVLSGVLWFVICVLYWVMFYVFIFSVINGFRRNIHTIVILVT
ncbi:uncharacterized protein LOC123668864 [Melitaea cinxia]|uniref:uncharacterized protein LOC123668864 n=1 Tax=Melitaea cinxia TaxID=113334 RepID=UPI001E26F29F|nr:uncharacterized protein LOC123668864 [Melitaea cinxia]